MGSKGWLKKVHFCISPFTSEVIDYEGGLMHTWRGHQFRSGQAMGPPNLLIRLLSLLSGIT